MTRFLPDTVPDTVTVAAVRALGMGDPLAALTYVALNDAPLALALRGSALAQLGDFARAKALLVRAKRAFASSDAVAWARCVVAQADVALATRDLAHWTDDIAAARAILAGRDAVNASYLRSLTIKRLVLIGHIDDAERALADGLTTLVPAHRAMEELMVAGVAMRRCRATVARAALQRADHAATRAGIPALVAEVEQARVALQAPMARRTARGVTDVIDLFGVERVLKSRALVIDACQYAFHLAKSRTSLARRPVLFALLRALGETWPNDASRDALMARAFGSQFTDASHRARLRVEVARLRRLLGPAATVRATTHGFVLEVPRGRTVVVLAPPVDDAHGALLALLADGQAWSTSALALALGGKQRGVQRSLDKLATAGKVQSFGRGRARRWVALPAAGFATHLLLARPLPLG